MRKISRIIVHHTAGNQSTSIQTIKKGHIARGFSDIGYHGVILKEKGVWKFKKGRDHRFIGAHCAGDNKLTLGISVAGNYEIQTLDSAAEDLLVDVLANWCFIYNLKPDSIKPHKGSGTTATKCPGKNILTKWESIINKVVSELNNSPNLNPKTTDPDASDH